MPGMPGDDLELRTGAARGVSLVATWPRWAASAGALGAAFVCALWGYLVFTRSEQPLGSFAWLIVAVCGIEGLLVLALLRAEESRVSRELRTARTGTAAMRALASRRRQQAPFLARLFAARLGTAAVLVADGDRAGALELLSGGSPLMRGGRLDRLRDVVDADIERATGTSVGLERCVQRLRGMEPIGHREADLYRTHVLVKALLEQGDADTAVEVAGDLERMAAQAQGQDEEQQLYATWLRVWFDLDAEAAGYRHAWPALPEGQLRMAALMARAHGADRLVEKLEERVSSIARRGRQE
jgi:hypothetical protein